MSGIGDEAEDLLHSGKGEQASDGALDEAAGAVDERTGGGHEEQVSKVEHTADTRIGE